MRLWFDDSQKKLYKDFNSTEEWSSEDLEFYVGDKTTIELYRVRSGAETGEIHANIEFPPNAIVRLALGKLTDTPTSGTWKITGGDDLNHNATAADVATAINASLGANTVTVTGDAGGPYTVTWAANGAQTLLAFDDAALFPSSAAHVRRIRTGTTGVPEIQRIYLRQTAVAFQETWVDINAVSQVETATAAGTITGDGNAKVTITSGILAGSPLDVSVAVTNTDTASTWAGKVRAALNATPAVTALYTVGGSGASITLTAITPAENDDELNIALDNDTCTGITPTPTSANTTKGSPFIGKIGVFSTKTEEAESVFTTGDSEAMLFELEFENESEEVTTGFQVDAVLKPGVINPTGNFPSAAEGATIGDNGWSPVFSLVEYSRVNVGDMPLNLSFTGNEMNSADDMQAYGIFEGQIVQHANLPVGTTVGALTDGNTVSFLSEYIIDSEVGITGEVIFIGTGGLLRALKVEDWTGGEGTKPAVGLYVGATGLVADIAEAVNVRGEVGATGATGAAGSNGTNGSNGLNADMTRTSTTSRTIGTGSVSFTYTATSSNLGWLVGTRLRFVSEANSANFMEGPVTSVSSSAVTANIDVTGGSGTYANWNISVSGGGGVQPIALGGTGATTASAARTALSVPGDDGTISTANVNKRAVVTADKTLGAMTDLIEALNPPKWVEYLGSSSTQYISGAGATTGSTAHGMTVSGSTASGYAVRQVDVNSFGASGLPTIGSAAYVVNWGKVIALRCRVCVTSGANDTGSVLQITLGRGIGEYTVKELTSKGVAFRWNPGSAAQLVTYNSAENAVNTTFTPAVSQIFELLLISNNGTVYCYVNGTQVGSTTTQAPAGNSNNYASIPQIGVFSTGAITNRVVAVCTPFKVFTE